MEQYLPVLRDEDTSADSVRLLVDAGDIDGMMSDSSGEGAHFVASPGHGSVNMATLTLADTLHQFAQGSLRRLRQFPARQDRPWPSPSPAFFATANPLRSCLAALRPSILSPPRKRKILPTSWLDGLRGIASFTVVVYHSQQVFYGGNCGAWYKDDPSIFRLPILRLQCTGTAMVDIFFVVSGYSLSYKPLSIIRANDFPRLASSIASSVLRRGIRLYLPVIAITLLNAIASCWQIFDVQGRDHVPYQAGFLDTIWYWLDDLMTGLNPFTVHKYRSWDMMGLRYEPVMWTIPYEYRGSMAVFAVLLVLGRIHLFAGNVILSMTTLYALAIGQWDIFLFLSGVLCCQVHHYPQGPQITSSLWDFSEKQRGSTGLRTFLYKASTICRLLVILYVLTIPDYRFGLGDIPFYATIIKADPRSWAGLPDTGRFPVCLSAVVLVLYVGHCQWLRDILSSRVPQYLGENSFAIYLIHFFLINTLGRPLMRALIAGKDLLGIHNGLMAILCEWLILILYASIALPVLFWCGELVTRFVDRKSVELAGWVDRKCVRCSAET